MYDSLPDGGVFIRNYKKLFTIRFKIVKLVAEINGAEIAQSVEQRTENPRVGGSIPSLGKIICHPSSAGRATHS